MDDYEIVFRGVVTAESEEEAIDQMRSLIRHQTFEPDYIAKL